MDKAKIILIALAALLLLSFPVLRLNHRAGEPVHAAPAAAAPRIVKAGAFDFGVSDIMDGLVNLVNPIIDKVLARLQEFIEPIITKFQTLAQKLFAPASALQRLKMEAVKLRFESWGPLGVGRAAGDIFTTVAHAKPDPAAGCLLGQMKMALPEGSTGFDASGGSFAPPGWSGGGYGMWGSQRDGGGYSTTPGAPIPTPGPDPTPTPTPSPSGGSGGSGGAAAAFSVRAVLPTSTGGQLLEYSGNPSFATGQFQGWPIDLVPSYMNGDAQVLYKFNNPNGSGDYVVKVDVCTSPQMNAFHLEGQDSPIVNAWSQTASGLYNQALGTVHLSSGVNIITIHNGSSVFPNLGYYVNVAWFHFSPVDTSNNGGGGSSTMALHSAAGASAALAASRAAASAPAVDAAGNPLYVPSVGRSSFFAPGRQYGAVRVGRRSLIRTMGAGGDIGAEAPTMAIIDALPGTLLGNCRLFVRTILGGLVWAALAFWIWKSITLGASI